MQDLLANPKCSLLVAKDPDDRTDLVITVHGDAVSVSSSFVIFRENNIFLKMNIVSLSFLVSVLVLYFPSIELRFLFPLLY